MRSDLLLSSGFLAFARHCGVLQAIEAAELDVDAVVGTSSGALIGSLWAAGVPAAEIERDLLTTRPHQLMRPHAALWKGLFSLRALIAWLEARLPPTFAELPRPFAVGVVGPDGQGTLLSEGPLAPAVAASCAIPWVFAPVVIEGTTWQDGGVVDRLMVQPWRAWRGDRPALAHVVAPSRGPETTDDLSDMAVVRTPRSGASFLSLGDVAAQVSEARRLASEVLASKAAPSSRANTPAGGTSRW